MTDGDQYNVDVISSEEVCSGVRGERVERELFFSVWPLRALL